MKKYFTPPRIAGALCIIIAILAYFAGRFDFKIFLLGVAGIVLASINTKYAQSSFDDFIGTFKRWQTIVITALYDAIFWLLLVFSAQFYQWKVQAKMLQTQASTMLTQAGLADAAQLSQNVTSLRSFLTVIIAGIVVLILFNLITYTISRGLIWTNIAEKKITKKFLLKFLGLNSLWWLIWIPIIFIILITLKLSGALKGSFTLVMTIAAFFTPILHTLYMNGRGLRSIGQAFGLGFSKLFKFAVPYCFAYIVLVIILVPTTIIFSLWPVRQPTMQAISMMIAVPWMAWLRIYLYPVIKKLM